MPEYIFSRPNDGTEYACVPTALLEIVYGRVTGADLEWVRGRLVQSDAAPPVEPAPPVGGDVYAGNILDGQRNWEFDPTTVDWVLEAKKYWVVVWVKVIGEPEHFDAHSVIGIDPMAPPPLPGTTAAATPPGPPVGSSTPPTPLPAVSLPPRFSLRLDREYISSNEGEISTLLNASALQAPPIALVPDLGASIPGSKRVYSAERWTDHTVNPEDPTTLSKWILEIPYPPPASPALWIAKVGLLQATDAAFDELRWYRIRFDPTVEQIYISATGRPHQVRISPA